MKTEALHLSYVGTNAAGTQYFENELNQDIKDNPNGDEVAYDKLELERCNIELAIKNSPDFIQAFNTHNASELEVLNQEMMSESSGCNAQMKAMLIADPELQKGWLPTDPNPLDWVMIPC